MDPAEDPPGSTYRRVTNIGGRQLQARVIDEEGGLSLQDILDGVTVLQ